MATKDFALFNADGSVEYALTHAAGNLPPWYATWEQAPVDTNLAGTPIYGRFATVTWDFSQYDRGVPVAMLDLFATLRGADGTIRFRTRDMNRAMSICTGKIDANLSVTYSSARARAHGLVVVFSRVALV